MPAQFRFADLSRYAEVAGFIGEHWAENHLYTRDHEMFEWTFRNPWWDDPDTYSFLLSEDETGITGALGGIPFRLNCRGITSRGIWIVNYVVRPDHRKGSLALQLLGKLRGDPYDVTVAFGINPATAVIYQVLRGQVVQEIPRFFAVLPEAEDRAAALVQRAYPDWMEDRARALVSAFRLPKVPESNAPVSYGIPATWDNRDWPALASSMIGASRDAAYLDWRYVRHPRFHYCILTVPEGERCGMVVYRIEDVRQNDEVVGRLGRLVEFLPVSPGNARELLSAFWQDIQRHNAIGADYYSHYGPTAAWLQEGGLKPAGGHPDGQMLPSRFQPLDGRGGNIMGALFRAPHIPVPAAGESCEWYWTKSDSDQDRPR